ncbi:hypothetical protein RCL1_008713 [Eukaryota sp. TZLM3-RCL]
MIAYENNVKYHFDEHLSRLVNVITNKSKVMRQLTEKEQRHEWLKQYKYIRECVMFGRQIDSAMCPLLCNECAEINIHLNELKMNFENNLEPDEEAKPAAYHAKSNPWSFFGDSIYVNRVVEQKGIDLEVPMTIYNVFPLRTSLVPGHMPLNTKSVLWSNLLGEEFTGTKTDTKKGLEPYKKMIWRSLLDNTNRIFKSNVNYSFDYSMSTNGFECSLLFKRIDLIGKEYSSAVPSSPNEMKTLETYL